jgi:hypothetical protein
MSQTLVAPRSTEITGRALEPRRLEAKYFELAGRTLHFRAWEAHVAASRFAQARLYAPMN